MSIHDMCLIATAAERCAYCHHQRGRPCTRGGPHLSRIGRAGKHGRITLLDVASVISDEYPFAGWHVVLDPEAAVA